MTYDTDAMAWYDENGDRVVWCAPGPGASHLWQWYCVTPVLPGVMFLGTFGKDAAMALRVFNRSRANVGVL